MHRSYGWEMGYSIRQIWYDLVWKEREIPLLSARSERKGSYNLMHCPKD
jgi:hypothetical protein